MKRILFLLIALTVAAFAGWYYWQFFADDSPALPMAALLPRETIFVAQMPDFNRARDEWQHCDIYQLYREPAVQDFLRKPLANVSKNGCGLSNAAGSRTARTQECLHRADLYRQ